MAGLTQPLHFRAHIRCGPPAGMDAMPFFDSLLILFLVALNTSLFVTAPGTTIDLPGTTADDAFLEGRVAVLTVGRNGLFFFEGMKIPTGGLQQQLKTYTEAGDGAKGFQDSSDVLLIKADQRISGEDLFALLDVARAAGFDRVHLAGEPGYATRDAEELGGRSGPR